ncbi:hypothetical protein ACFCZ6_26060 [Streptomyces hydrogenans]|uniref:hypothetical protein n=1 Tax=Streptomyces hydrogenans TaxID=1873719 RepID=UPI0035E39DB1
MPPSSLHSEPSLTVSGETAGPCALRSVTWVTWGTALAALTTLAVLTTPPVLLHRGWTCRVFRNRNRNRIGVRQIHGPTAHHTSRPPTA